MTAWQPIESAPRDGTEILVCSPNNNPRTARYMTSIEDGDSVWIIARSVGERAVAFAYVDPTHWQPLPDPPAVETVTRLFVPQAAVAPREMPALGWDEALVTG